MTSKTLHTYDERHKQFLEAGKKLVLNTATGPDMSKVSAAAIARACKCTAPLVFAHFKDRDVLRNDVRTYIKSGKIAPRPKAVPVVKVTKPAPKKPAPKPASVKKAALKIKQKPKVKVVAKKPTVAPTSAKNANAGKTTKIVTVAKASGTAGVPAKLAPPPAPSNAE